MSDYTKGPWFYDRRTGSIGCRAGWIVGPNWHDNKSDAEFGDLEADAKLIALAPDMVEVCKALSRYAGEAQKTKTLTDIMKMADRVLDKLNGGD